MKRSISPRCIILFSLIFLSCGFPLFGTGTSSTQVFLLGKTFEFPPVLDGETVRHDFIVVNRGNDQLDLLEVKPDCGCTTVSYPPRIPPGGKGKIAILLNTTGFGGEHLVKTIAVRTNDKNIPVFNLVMTGDVRPLAGIDPSEVKLTGTVGQEIKQTVTITPVRDNPFKILEVRAEKGKDLRYELHEVKSPGIRKYRLDVFNTRTIKGWYIDTIYLKTTSNKSPVFKVRVLGMIREPQPPRS